VDLGRAFTFPFDDEDWVGKLVMVIVWTLVAAIPLIGLVGAAALAGYVVELLRNMRRGDENPLPRWDNLGEKITDGANVLIASFVYNLGNLLMFCGLLILLPAMRIGDNGAASTVALAITCCLSLIMLVYNFAIWPLLAVGTAYYAQSGQINAFFQLGRIWNTINRHAGLTGQWIIYTLLAGLLLGLVGSIPCLGWLIGLGLGLPVQGHLLGQFAQRIDEKPKSKPKPQPRRVR